MEHMIDNDIDVCFLQETFLSVNDSVKVQEVRDYGFNIMSKPRPRHGGGTAIIYKNNVKLQVNNHVPKYKTFEVMEATLQTKDELLRLTNIYRPPYSKKNRYTPKSFLQEFEEYLDSLDEKTGTSIIVGDINIHAEKVYSLDTIRYKELLNNAMLSQHINCPTHDEGGTLDHVITSVHLDSKIKDIEVVESGTLSDHFFVSFSISDCTLPKPVTSEKVLHYRNFRDINVETFKKDICNSVLNQSDHFTSLDDACALYQETLTDIMDRHCPVVKKTIKPRHHPWFDDSLRDLRRKRRAAERRFRKCKSPEARLDYINLRNKFSRMEYGKKTSFHRRAFKDCSSDIKKTFQKINKLTGVESKHIPETSNTSELSEDFKDFFSDKVSNIRKNVEDLQNSTVNNHDDDDDASLPCPESFKDFRPLSLEELEGTIKGMSNKFCELDPIPTWLLKSCLPELSKILLYIVNSSITQGTFPTSMKHAIIKPALKKYNADPDSLKNYRPISNLSFLSKMLERVVLDQLNCYLEQQNLFCPEQSGYRPHHSCETLLIRMKEDIVNNIDHRRTIALLLLDLSSAFDTIDHDLLIRKLQEQYGTTGNALAWFKSYLAGRTFAVGIKDVKSTIGYLLFGVPQGSILGPVLFVLYTKDLHKIATKHGLTIKLYADDSQLYIGFSSANAAEVNDVLKRIECCLKDIKQWMVQNFMKLNEDKTEFILLGAKNDMKKIGSLTLEVDGTLITNITCDGDAAKSLGVMMDENMNMQRQIAEVRKKCAWQLSNLYKIRRYLTINLKIMLVKTLIISKLDYCNALYAGLPKTQIKRLNGVLRNCIRFIYDLKTQGGEDLDKYFVKAHILPVDKRIEFKICLFIHKALHAKVPDYLESLIEVYQPAISALRNAKDKYLLAYPPLTKLNKKKLCSQQFSHHAPTLWNSLPYIIRSCQKTNDFKSKLKTYFFREAFGDLCDDKNLTP